MKPTYVCIVYFEVYMYIDVSQYIRLIMCLRISRRGLVSWMCELTTDVAALHFLHSS